MNTADAYTAVLVGSPDTPLHVEKQGSSVTLADTQIPHVQGRVNVAMPGSWSLISGKPVWTPDTATYAALDPRGAKRIKVTATSSNGSQSRTFDLSFRVRDVDHDTGIISLEASSDEAVLNDFAQTSDDLTPLNYQSSLRNLVGYVLGKIGATLNTAGSAADVAVPALAAADNLIQNPKVVANTVGWFMEGGFGSAVRETSGGPSVSPSYYRFVPNAGATGVRVYIDENTVPVRADTNYKMVAWVYAQGSQQVTLDALIVDSTGLTLSSATPVTVTPGTSWVKLVCPFYTRSTGAKIRPRLTVAGSAAATSVGLTAVRVSLDSGDVNDSDFWDGDTSDTAQYSYVWADATKPNASTTRRTPAVEAATPDALTWRAGQSGMDFLTPLVQRFGLRLVCDEARVWTLRSSAYTTGGQLMFRHAVNLHEASDRIDRNSDIWFDGCVVRYAWTDRDGKQQTRYDAYPTTGTPSKVVRSERPNTPYPGPGLAQYLVSRALTRGREITVQTVADWTAKAEMPLVAYLDGVPAQTGASSRVVFDLSTDRMTVTSRTTDTPAGAIDLKSGTINSLSGNINSQ